MVPSTTTTHRQLLHLSKQFDEAWMTVGFVVLFLECSFVELLQAEGADEVFGMELLVHCSDTSPCRQKQISPVQVHTWRPRSVLEPPKQKIHTSNLWLVCDIQRTKNLAWRGSAFRSTANRRGRRNCRCRTGSHTPAKKKKTNSPCKTSKQEKTPIQATSLTLPPAVYAQFAASLVFSFGQIDCLAEHGDRGKRWHSQLSTW